KGNRSHNTAAFTTPYNFCQKKCCHSTVVKIDGKEIKRINLDDSKEFIKTYYPSKGQYNTIEVKNGHVRVKKDNSPDQIAVKTGWISEPGQTSICIPHRFILEIVQQYSKDYYIY
ncbi:NusG domain II-containing protein, partial [Enterococcus faecalis]|uniref:NusG domain II-containing protein n=1 Tax=Enterococcus faecalis TaxID=1351 RepID=UPI00215CC6A3